MRGTAAVALLERRAAARSTIAAIIFAVFTAACGLMPAACDSVTYVGHSPGRYWYFATASDRRWDVGDVIRLEGMEQVTDAGGWRGGLEVAYTAQSVTWTCTRARPGRMVLTLSSTALAGQIPFSIASNSPATGLTTGPQYLPEPTTTILFCGGLIALAALVGRRTRSRTRPK